MKKIIILLISILILSSCGARKVTRDKSIVLISEGTTETISDSVGIKENIETDVIIHTDVEEEETIITPKDNTKEFIVDGKTYKNVIIRKYSKKDKSIKEDKTISKRDSVSSNKGRSVKFNIKETSLDIKSTEREEPFQFYLYIFLFALLLLLLYWAYKRFKNLI